MEVPLMRAPLPIRYCDRCGRGLTITLERLRDCVTTYYQPCTYCPPDSPPSIRPPLPTPYENAVRQLRNTSAGLQNATRTLQETRTALDEATRAHEAATANYHDLLRRMAEAVRLWTAYGEKEGKG